MRIGVAGMVGVGKTTLTRKLGEYLHFRLLLESVGEDNPWLDLYYGSEDGQSRYGFHLQAHFLVSRMKTLRQIHAEGVHYITDTIADADAQIFARRLYEQGHMSDIEWQLYSRLYEELLHSPAGTPPDVLIYLSAPLEEVLRRIRARGRKSEQDVDITYWTELHDRYERWAESYDLSPIVRLDARSYDLKHDPYAVVGIADRLRRTLGPEFEICLAEARDARIAQQAARSASHRTAARR